MLFILLGGRWHVLVKGKVNIVKKKGCENLVNTNFNNWTLVIQRIVGAHAEYKKTSSFLKPQRSFEVTIQGKKERKHQLISLYKWSVVKKVLLYVCAEGIWIELRKVVLIPDVIPSYAWNNDKTLWKRFLWKRPKKPCFE